MYKELFSLRYLVFTSLIGLILSTTTTFGQRLCSGVYGDTLIFKDFGTGTARYSTETPQSLGFSSTFKNRLLNTPSLTTNDGYYSIVNSVPDDFNVWHTNALDHTPNDVNGYMLLVNGDQLLGEFYRDTIKGLCVGSTYEFSSWLGNVFRPNANPRQQNPPNVRFEIRNLAGQMIDSLRTGPINMTNALTWGKYGITFVSPATSVILVMVSVAPRGVGNDIVIDDISFVPCIPATISITPTVTVCEGGNGSFTVSVAGNADYKYSQWQISRDNGNTWNYTGNIIEETSGAINYNVSLPLTNIPFSDDKAQFRLVLGTSPGNLSSVNSVCNVISPISNLVVNKYPSLVITDPQIVCNTVVDITNPNIITGSSLNGGKLTYYTTLANATNGANPMSLVEASAIKVSGTYFIKAATNTNPVCTDIKPVVVKIDPAKKVSLQAVNPICKDNPNIDVTATLTNSQSIEWKFNSDNTSAQQGNNTRFQMVLPQAYLQSDSVWVKVATTDNVVICPNVKDSIKINLLNPPFVKLPTDTVFCENMPNLNLQLTASTVNSPTKLAWTTSESSVTPSPNNAVNSTINLSNKATNVSIYVEASTVGCKISRDTMLVRFVRRPVLNASNDTSLCHKGDQDITIPLKAKLKNGTIINWGSSQGNLSLTNDSNAVLTIPKNNKLSMIVKVNIDLKNKYCPADTESVYINLATIPNITLPKDTSFCHSGDVKTFILNSKGGLYSQISGKSKFGNLSKINDSTFSYTYKPAMNATVNDSISVEVTNKSCPKAIDNMVVKYLPNPVVVASEDLKKCTNDSVIQITSQGLNVDQFTWQTDDLSGIFSMPNNFSTNYLLSNNKHSDTIKFVINALSNNCGLVKDSLVYIYEKPVKLSIKDSIYCSDDYSLGLYPTVIDIKGNPLPFLWKTRGSGTFVEQPNSGDVKYVPSLKDQESGMVDIVLASVGQKVCANKDTSYKYEIVLNPISEAGKDSVICLGFGFDRVVQNNKKWTYQWDLEDKLGVKIGYSKTNSLSFVPSDTTKVLLVVRNTRGCVDSSSFLVLPIAPPTIELPQHLCFVQNLRLIPQLNMVPSIGKFFWMKDGVVIDSSKGVNSLAVSQSGYYKFKFKALGCVAQDSCLITLPPQLVVKDQLACVGSNVTLQANSILKANYTWKGYLGNTNKLEVVAKDAPFDVLVSVKDSLGCLDSTLVTVRGVPRPEFNMSSKDVCEGEVGSISVKLKDSTLKSFPISHQWNINGVEEDLPSWEGINFTKTAKNKLLLSIGTCEYLDSLVANVRPIPNIVAKENYKYCNDELDSIVLKSEGVYKHSWYQGNKFLAESNEVKVHPEVYTIFTLNVESIYGCKASKPIIVDVCCAPRLFVPNVITLNSNDQNAQMQIFGAHFSDLDLTIFNRWGEIIYHTKDRNKPWDGHYLNDEMPIGVYPWVITYRGVCPDYDGKYKMKGDVTIIK